MTDDTATESRARKTTSTTDHNQNPETKMSNTDHTQRPDADQQTEKTTADSTNRTDRARQKVGEMDHAPPVEGTRRSYERGRENTPARTDGGKRTTDESTAGTEEEPESDEETDEETKTDGGTEGRYRPKVKDMDHTPPVEGANRTYERGPENDDDDGDVADE